MKKSWEIKTLGEVLTLEYGKALDKNERDNNGSYPVYGANGIKDRTNKYIYDRQTIIIGRKGTAGAINLSEEKFYALDVTYYATFNHEKYNTKFLYYLLEIKDLPSLAKGVKPGINRNDVYNIIGCFPPIKEQEEIVEKLDKGFELIDSLKETAKKNLDNAKELFQSVLREELSPKEGWETKTLGEVCDFVRGPFGGSLKKNCFVEKGYAVYEQQNAIYNRYEFRYFIDANKFCEMSRFKVNSGDLIMSCSGTMGKISIVPNSAPEGIINQALLKLTIKKEIINTYLKCYIESETFQDTLKKLAQGVAVENVASVKILKQIPIPIPPIKEQEEIVGRLDRIKGYCEELEGNYKRVLELCEELKQGLLREAFSY